MVCSQFSGEVGLQTDLLDTRFHFCGIFSPQHEIAFYFFKGSGIPSADAHGLCAQESLLAGLGGRPGLTACRKCPPCCPGPLSPQDLAVIFPPPLVLCGGCRSQRVPQAPGQCC